MTYIVLKIIRKKFAFYEPTAYICRRKPKAMIHNFNIKAWWWRPQALVNNECGTPRV